MWKVLGNATLDESAAAPRPQPQRRPNSVATSKSSISSSHQQRQNDLPKSRELSQSSRTDTAQAVICDGKYRITGTMRKGATGYLYSGVEISPSPATANTDVADHANKEGGVGATDGMVVLKIEECAAPKRQMQNEWQVYRALEAQRVATKDTPDPLPAAGVGGFPRAEFCTTEMPSLPSSVRNDFEALRRVNVGGLAGSRGVDGLGVGGTGKVPAVNVLAMERLGDNLMNLSQGCRGRRFSLQTTLRLGSQMVPLLRMLHSTGYVHRDIKPENFCVGRGKQSDRVFLIDCGLACRAEDPAPAMPPTATAAATDKAVEPPQTAASKLPTAGKSSEETPAGTKSTGSLPKQATTGGTGPALVGSVRYLSICAHAGVRQTPRCDLESLGYVLVYLVRGKLPWQGLTARTREAHMEKIRKSKTEEIPETLCKGLPALVEYLAYVRGLPPGEPVDYTHAERTFTDGLRRRGFPPNAPFDWMNAHHPAPVTALAAVTSSGNVSKGPPPGGTGLRATKLDSVGEGLEPLAAKQPRTVLGIGTADLPTAASGANAGGKMAVARGDGANCFVRAPSAPTVAAVFDLYADVPPPDELASSAKRARKNSFGAESTPKAGGTTVVDTRAAFYERRDVVSTERTAKVLPLQREATPTVDKGVKSIIEPTTTNEGSASTTGARAGAVDVSVAIAKLRPHLIRGRKTGSGGEGGSSKKFLRACALLENLLAAKLTTDNEEIFFNIVSDTVAGATLSSSPPMETNPTIVISSGTGGGVGVSSPGGFVADGAAGKAVGRLVAAACTKSSVFSAHRREKVDMWGKEVLERERRAVAGQRVGVKRRCGSPRVPQCARATIG